MVGFWEFFGGKIEQGEILEVVLKCELLEEIGIVVKEVVLFKVLEYIFIDCIVILSFYMVEVWDGEFFGCEGQLMCWVK